MTAARALAEAEFPAHLHDRAVKYVCNERIYYYLLTQYYDFAAYPLVYLDRCLGWAFSRGPHPLLPRYDGFSGLIDRHLSTTIRVRPQEVAACLRRAFSAGGRACVAMHWTLPDGFGAITSVLLDGMQGDVVYFTKINDSNNKICSPMPLGELISSIALEDDENVEVTLIAPSSALQVILGSSPADVFAALFGEYEFSVSESQAADLTRYGVPVFPDLTGFADLAAYLDGAEAEIIVAGAVPRLRQFRLSKSLHSSIVPVQHFLEYVTETTELARLLPDPVMESALRSLAGLRHALSDVQKFASLLVQLPEPGIYRMYVDAIRRLEAAQPGCQRAGLDILLRLGRTAQPAERCRGRRVPAGAGAEDT